MIPKKAILQKIRKSFTWNNLQHSNGEKESKEINSQSTECRAGREICKHNLKSGNFYFHSRSFSLFLSATSVCRNDLKIV